MVGRSRTGKQKGQRTFGSLSYDLVLKNILHRDMAFRRKDVIWHRDKYKAILENRPPPKIHRGNVANVNAEIRRVLPYRADDRGALTLLKLDLYAWK